MLKAINEAWIFEVTPEILETKPDKLVKSASDFTFIHQVQYFATLQILVMLNIKLKFSSEQTW